MTSSDAMWEALSAPLVGAHVALEPVAERHLEALRAVAADPLISRWLPVALYEPDGFARWHAEMREAMAAQRAVAFATVAQADGAVLGSTCFLELRPEHRCVEIGATWLGQAAWGTGANVEAKLLMLAAAFERAGCIRVELKTDARNERSRRAIEALPAQFEGIHRQHRILPDSTLRDSAWYSILDREWPEVRANLERRLAGVGAR